MNKFARVSVLILGLSSGATIARAGTIYTNDFSTAATGFTGGTLMTAPSGNQFLEFGGAGGSATLNLSGIAPHSSVTLSYTLDVVGSMDGTGPTIQGGGIGDYFTISYSGSSTSTVFNQAFANYGGGNLQTYPTAGSQPGTGAATLNALGYTGFPNSGNGIQDSEYNFTLTPVVDSAGTFSFTFTDGSNEGMANEFYGIDNLVVTTAAPIITPVPEPASLAVLGTGLIALGLYRTRRLRIDAEGGRHRACI